MPTLADALTDPVAIAADDMLQRFRSPARLICALSGGSDSTGLLRALHAALPRHPGLSLEACTIDHGLRPASADEARAMAALCAQLGIAHHIRRWEGEKPASGLQAAARLARYRLLVDVAQARDAQAILSGHTANDQAETIAMRSLRSAPGQPGLAGMAPAVLLFGQVWLLRPFLPLSRAQIRLYLQSLGQAFIDDPSNDNPRFERVRLRQSMEPACLQPRPFFPFSKASDRAASGARIAALMGEEAASVGEGILRLSPRLCASAGEDDTARAIALLAAAMGGKAMPVGRETMGRVATFLQGGMPGRMTASGVVFDRRREGLFLYREARDLPVTRLLSGQEALWDGRYHVRNLGAAPLVLSSGGDAASLSLGHAGTDIADAVPKGVVRRAARAALRLSFADDRPVTRDMVVVRPALTLYDTFLPCFDRMIADQIAILIGCERYIRVPLTDLLQSGPW
ncbi:tRNA lysidine(34) synthetase TilS [Xaviernesmea oryzae]|uniref:tRNA(Ile)-lysidine synthase n=1 Tax=Xaviernesmea oryzae TaxID=464029 RepID=A0A1Q9AZK9_9HYPH|nr:tRNA lysidine(34) synthetase TilS [Xaviernesmea oryzae]OLP61114.1 tRNA lysidine(34) synthetase TilS [Xaviernesmea oryzae]SEL12866.1 tRNA(Ile)-lysidine synthase [Xaviernesmea oryzae]